MFFIFHQDHASCFTIVREPDRGETIEDPEVKWRVHKPDYTLANLAYLQVVGGGGAEGGTLVDPEVEWRIHKPDYTDNRVFRI